MERCQRDKRRERSLYARRTSLAEVVLTIPVAVSSRAGSASRPPQVLGFLESIGVAKIHEIVLALAYEKLGGLEDLYLRLGREGLGIGLQVVHPDRMAVACRGTLGRVPVVT